MTHFQALILPPIVIAIIYWTGKWWLTQREDPHSPDPGVQIRSWINRLLKRDPDPDPDPDPEDDPDGEVGDRTFRVIPSEDGVPGHWHVNWKPKRHAPLPPPAEPDGYELTSRQEWVETSLRNGARPVTIMAEGASLYGVSQVTIKRDIAFVRKHGRNL